MPLAKCRPGVAIRAILSPFPRPVRSQSKFYSFFFCVANKIAYNNKRIHQHLSCNSIYAILNSEAEARRQTRYASINEIANPLLHLRNRCNAGFVLFSSTNLMTAFSTTISFCFLVSSRFLLSPRRPRRAARPRVPTSRSRPHMRPPHCALPACRSPCLRG